MKPVNLRRDDLAVRKLTKIMANEKYQKVAECFQNWKVKMKNIWQPVAKGC